MVGCECAVCESGDPRDKRTRCGALIAGPAGNVLIDTPPELRIQLLREGVSAVHAALFTHGHADHVVGLDDLRICGLRQKQAIPLYCEEAVAAHLKAAFHYAFAPPNPAAHPGSVPQYLLRQFGPMGRTMEVAGLPIVPLRLYHGALPVLGFRVGDCAYCTDVSAFPDESIAALAGVRTLVIDALREEPHPTHLHVDGALEIIRRVQPKQAYLTHIAHQLGHHSTDAKLPEGVAMAWDGLKIDVRID